MSAILPVLSVLVMVLATAVPWGLPADATFILPLVVVTMVFCWRAIPGAVMPEAIAMLLGLLTDVTTGGPLGFWALLCLIACSVGARARVLGERHDLSALWLVWIGLAAALAVFGWLVASLYFFRWVDWWPIAFGAMASVALFPVVLHGLLEIQRSGGFAPRGSLHRRGWA